MKCVICCSYIFFLDTLKIKTKKKKQKNPDVRGKVLELSFEVLVFSLYFIQVEDCFKIYCPLPL